MGVRSRLSRDRRGMRGGRSASERLSGGLSYGRGWECDRGYRQANEACAVVEVPPQRLPGFPRARLGVRARLRASRPVMRRNQATCERLSGGLLRPRLGVRSRISSQLTTHAPWSQVPPNAFLDSRGRDWECDRGYRKADQSCVAVKLPANAYLDSSGDRWKCERGYGKRRVVLAIEIPHEGYLASSGRDWECNRGYRKSGESCVAVAVPANGYLASSGRDWQCDRKYRKSGQSCVALEIPANAHIGSSGNDWTCNSGYRRQRRKLYFERRLEGQ